MFIDLDWPLNASSLLSASAELLVIFPVWLEIAYSRPFWDSCWRILPQMNFDIVATHRRTVLGRNHVVWAINWKSIHGFDLGACPRKNTVPTNQQSHKPVIFHMSGEKPPLNGFKWKFAQETLSWTLCSNLKNFRDFDVIGAKFALSHWLCSCTWALPQCSATALPVKRGHPVILMANNNNNLAVAYTFTIYIFQNSIDGLASMYLFF